jgi:AraC-like DNA-binding protein
MASSDTKPEKAVATQSAVHAPDQTLASCVRAYVTRSTLGVLLEPHQRHNFYPATLACAISWTLQGHTELVRVGDQYFNAKAPSPVMFSGPHSLPSETRNPGPVQFFLLLFMPDAFYALTGVDLLMYTNQHRPLHAVLDANWQGMADRVMAASSDEARIRVIEDFLLPRWNTARPRAWATASNTLMDWAQSLAMRYLTSSMGRGLRQVERRIKQWTGQTHRQLRRLARGERTFLLARNNKQRDTLVWSDLAVESGYSDQSHLCREFRKLTGLRPDQVMHHMDTDERLWIFKAWA